MGPSLEVLRGIELSGWRHLERVALPMKGPQVVLGTTENLYSASIVPSFSFPKPLSDT
jgi:hypothetical protein